MTLPYGKRPNSWIDSCLCFEQIFPCCLHTASIGFYQSDRARCRVKPCIAFLHRGPRPQGEVVRPFVARLVFQLSTASGYVDSEVSINMSSKQNHHVDEKGMFIRLPFLCSVYGVCIASVRIRCPAFLRSSLAWVR